MEISPIAYFRSPLGTKFGIPKQSGLAKSLQGYIEFTPEWRDPEALRGIDGFDFLWLIWGFSANKHKAVGTTVRPPVLGGNTRMGVWATRSPFRPNNLGLSAVRIVGLEEHSSAGMRIVVSGADLMDGTPIYDIKPYVPYADAHPEARSGFTGLDKLKTKQVVLHAEMENMLSPELVVSLREVLSLDPRPQYHDDANRVYGMDFGGHDVRFRVDGDSVIVVEIV